MATDTILCIQGKLLKNTIGKEGIKTARVRKRCSRRKKTEKRRGENGVLVLIDDMGLLREPAGGHAH